MQYLNDPRQTRLIDPFENILSPLAYKQLKVGWQHLFRETVLELMPVEALKKHFDPTFGQPTKELYSMCGLVFITEFMDWTIPEAANAYMFRTDIHERHHDGLGRKTRSERRGAARGASYAVSIVGAHAFRGCEEGRRKPPAFASAGRRGHARYDRAIFRRREAQRPIDVYAARSRVQRAMRNRRGDSADGGRARHERRGAGSRCLGGERRDAGDVM